MLQKRLQTAYLIALILLFVGCRTHKQTERGEVTQTTKTELSGETEKQSHEVKTSTDTTKTDTEIFTYEETDYYPPDSSNAGTQPGNSPKQKRKWTHKKQGEKKGIAAGTDNQSGEKQNYNSSQVDKKKEKRNSTTTTKPTAAKWLIISGLILCVFIVLIFLGKLKRPLI